MSFEYRGLQDGDVVFGVSATTHEEAANEGWRYAAQYAADGPVQLQMKVGRRWVKMADVFSPQEPHSNQPQPLMESER